MRAVLDSDVLIKITKSSVKETVLSDISADMPKVKEEVVDEGKKRGCPNSVVIDHNMRAGKIKVLETSRTDYTERMVAGLNILG
jgi:hypothetical protein